MTGFLPLEGGPLPIMTQGTTAFCAKAILWGKVGFVRVLRGEPHRLGQLGPMVQNSKALNAIVETQEFDLVLWETQQETIPATNHLGVTLHHPK